MSFRTDLREAVRIRLNMFTQSGLKPDDDPVVEHMTTYITDLLRNEEVVAQAREQEGTRDGPSRT